MLPFDIEYYKPTNINEALEQFLFLEGQNKRPMYYSGGTEILTLGRLNMIQTGSLIDIKSIPETQVFTFDKNHLIIGTGLPLTFIEETNYFPLLTQVSMGIADHTARNKITLGGNLCGLIFYREAVLPFLLCDSQVVLAEKDGVVTIPIHLIFNKTFQLKEGQFLIQTVTEIEYTKLPFISIKKRQQWETGYPLLTVASVKVDNRLRFAFSGLCPFPFRSKEMETELNNTSFGLEERINNALRYLPDQVLDDIEGSREYRIIVLRNTLKEIILKLGER